MSPKLSWLVLIALAVTISASSQGLAHKRNPYYLRARNDLRTAGRLMQVHDDPDVIRNFRAADGPLQEAIRLIDTNSVIERKPPIDPYLDSRSRHLAIFRLLASAKRDLGRKDSLLTGGWRDATIAQIDEVMRRVNLIVQVDWHRTDSLSRYESIISSTFGGVERGPPF